MKQHNATLVAESPPVKRKEIYLGEAILRALVGRKDSLTTIMNMIADRYQGILFRVTPIVCTMREEDVYRSVMAESRGHLESHEIAVFPDKVKDWLLRNPLYPWSAYDRVKDAPYPNLVQLIDRLERE